MANDNSFFQLAPMAGRLSPNSANATTTSMIQRGPGMTPRIGARQSTLTPRPRWSLSVLRRRTILSSHWFPLIHGSVGPTRLRRASGGWWIYTCAQWNLDARSWKLLDFKEFKTVFAQFLTLRLIEWLVSRAWKRTWPTLDTCEVSYIQNDNRQSRVAC